MVLFLKVHKRIFREDLQSTEAGLTFPFPGGKKCSIYVLNSFLDTFYASCAQAIEISFPFTAQLQECLTEYYHSLCFTESHTPKLVIVTLDGAFHRITSLVLLRRTCGNWENWRLVFFSSTSFCLCETFFIHNSAAQSLTRARKCCFDFPFNFPLFVFRFSFLMDC